MTKILPRAITSYDLLKTLAVVLMMTDHAGVFFFPGDHWWRVAGRLCVPIWFFLIGYANSRDTGPRLWIALGIMTLFHLAAGGYLLPLDVLATILLVRLVLDRVMRFAAANLVCMGLFCAAAAALIWPSAWVTDYGTAGLILAMTGALLRQAQAGEGHALALPVFMPFAFVAFMVQQALLITFTLEQYLVMGAGVALIFFILLKFRPVSYPELTDAAGSAAKIIQFFGRWTLEIYVVHFIVFKSLAIFLHDRPFPARDFAVFIH